MHTLQLVGDYLWANKEWLFGGVGITIVASAGAGLAWLYRRRRASRTVEGPPVATGSGFDKAPRLEFADGIVAEAALSIELRVEEIFQLIRRFKTEQELHSAFTPRIHIRMAQIMEVHTYAEAKRRREDFEKQLVSEFAPQYREYGVRLIRIGIGTFVRRN